MMTGKQMLTEPIMILVEPKFFEEIETLRKRESRSTFVRYLLKLGLVEYKKKKKEAQQVELGNVSQCRRIMHDGNCSVGLAVAKEDARMKATIQVERSDVSVKEKVGDFEYTPETYREKVEKLKELLGRAKLEL